MMKNLVLLAYTWTLAAVLLGQDLNHYANLAKSERNLRVLTPPPYFPNEIVLVELRLRNPSLEPLHVPDPESWKAGRFEVWPVVPPSAEFPYGIKTLGAGHDSTIEPDARKIVLQPGETRVLSVWSDQRFSEAGYSDSWLKSSTLPLTPGDYALIHPLLFQGDSLGGVPVAISPARIVSKASTRANQGTVALDGSPLPQVIEIFAVRYLSSDYLFVTSGARLQSSAYAGTLDISYLPRAAVKLASSSIPITGLQVVASGARGALVTVRLSDGSFQTISLSDDLRTTAPIQLGRAEKPGVRDR